VQRSRLTVRSRSALVLVAVVGVTGCGGGGGADSADGVLGSASDYSVAGALAELPGQLGREDLQIVTGDLEQATEAAGLERPTDLTDADAMARWLGPLQAQLIHSDATDDDVAAFVPFPEVFGLPRDVEELDAVLGWSVLDAAWFVEHNAPPTRFSIVTGAFDDDTLAEDLIPTGDDVVSTGEGDDLETALDGRSAVDNLGRPVRLAYDDGRIASSLTTPLVREWLDGADDTLADDPELRAVAEALDDGGVYAALLLRPISRSSFDAAGGLMSAEDLEAIESMVLPTPFHTVAIGWATDEDGMVMTVVYQHDAEGDAAANTAALGAIFGSGRSMVTGQELQEFYDLVEVEHDGTLAVATVRPGSSGGPRTIFDAAHRRDIPFLHR
jgi:hypothetical protein